MVAEAYTFGDVDVAVRAWARGALPSLGNRVFYQDPAALPTPGASATPFVVINRIAGPDDRAIYQFDVWGQNQRQASQTAAVLATAIKGIAHYISNGVILYGADVDDVKWLPDEAGKPRCIVQALISASGGA